MPEGPTQTALLCQAQAGCADCWSEIGGCAQPFGMAAIAVLPCAGSDRPAWGFQSLKCSRTTRQWVPGSAGELYITLFSRDT